MSMYVMCTNMHVNMACLPDVSGLSAAITGYRLQAVVQCHSSIVQHGNPTGFLGKATQSRSMRVHVTFANQVMSGAVMCQISHQWCSDSA